MKHIPLNALERQHAALVSELETAIRRVVENSAFILGEEVSRFEKNFADYLQIPYAIGVANGTDAITLVLQALEVGQGDEVITAAFGAPMTVGGIMNAGAAVRFVDIESSSPNIDPNQVEKAITKNTKAIVVVHLHGQPANMDPILKIGKQYKISIIEDAAQAHGAMWKKQRLGTFGAAGIFSFFPGKNLGCWGDGGMVVITDPKLDKKIRMMRNHGREKKHEHEFLGKNSRLDALQAAVLDAKLPYLDMWNKERRDIALRYTKELKQLPIITPWEIENTYHVYHAYVIRVKNRDSLAEYLNNRGIQTGLHFPIPLHKQKAFQNALNANDSFPVTEKLADEILTLPCFPYMKTDEIDYVTASIYEWFKNEKKSQEKE